MLTDKNGLSIEKLPEVAENVLSGLTADASLKQRIYAAAAGSGAGVSRMSPVRFIAVSCCLALVAACTFMGIRFSIQKQNEAEVAFQAFSSASHTVSSPVFLQDFLNP